MSQHTWVNTAFGLALREVRLHMGMSQEQLGLESGVNRNTIGKIERAEMSPTWELIVRIARALEVQPAHLAEVAGRHAPRATRRASGAAAQPVS